MKTLHPTFSLRLLPSLVCATLLAGCQSTQTEEQAVVAPLRPVKTVEMSAGNGAAQRVLAGTIVSADSQNLSFRISGSINALPVDVGDRLGAGDLVASLDTESLKLSEKEARAQLAQAQANSRNADSQYQRTRDLYSTEAASLADLENAKTNASTARANLSLAREGLNAARLNLDYSELRNPSDNCQVVSVPVAINQNISGGQTVVTTACGDQLRMRTTVPESLINRIDVGQPVAARLHSGNTTLSGKVVEVAVSNNSGSGYPVEVALETPPANVRVGMAGDVTFDLSNDGERLLLPLNAVMSDGDGKFVFVAEPEEQHYAIARYPVQTGELDNQGIEITGGLDIGQRVVVAGMSRVSEGMKVTLYTSTDQ